MVGRKGFESETSPPDPRGTVGGTDKPHCARCHANIPTQAAAEAREALNAFNVRKWRTPEDGKRVEVVLTRFSSSRLP